MQTQKTNPKSPLFQMTLPPTTIDDLPDDILHKISIQLIEASPHTPSALAPLCRVNQRWNTLFTPTLYTHFTYSGDPSSIPKLWSFLRTIHRRPDLASLVHSLILTTTHLNEPTLAQAYHPDWTRFFNMLRELAAENYHWVLEALAEGGMADLYDDVYAAFFPAPSGQQPWDIVHWGKYIQSLTALVMALCPNVTRLDVHVHPDDKFLKRTLNSAVASRSQMQLLKDIDMDADLDIAFDTDDDDNEVPTSPDSTISGLPFQNLQTLILSPAFSSVPGNNSNAGTLVLGDEYPFHLLPNLKDLSIQGPNANIQITPGTQTTMTPIETLTLSNLRVQNLLPGLARLALPEGSTQALTSNLRSLTLTLPDIGAQNNNARLYSPLWAVLNHLRNQLVALDVQQTVNEHNCTLDLELEPDSSRWAHNLDMCTSLSTFPKLTRLNVSLWILVALNCTHPHPYRLISHLPPNVKELGIYNHPRLLDVMWEDATLRFNLPYELENTVLWSSKRCLAKAVMLEDGRSVEIMDAVAGMMGVGELFD
ncbi:uncharacterized protein DSM5745_09834 [Aspergillus mulundensis]|uniref:F-box domain-containing protein n=1 Tax=Aspergillus mulundensis TaxID=1810919 RepID=A0A3D8QRH7_9EURO|nr:hypothetical protein DSM5745_09834 [Aspergillus mulundensis]RDW64423.1 hypothetical protein DSM5745_09834 [Aspergillus mulundensis]